MLPGMPRLPPSARDLPRVVWLLGFASLFNDISSEAIFPLLPLFIASLPGGDVRYIGFIEGAAEALGSLTRVVAGRWSDRGPRRLLVVGGYSLPALARAGIALALAPWHVLTARLLDRLGKGIRSGPRDALLADAAPPGETGRAFGLQRSMDHLGAAVGPLLASGLLALGVPLRWTFAAAAGMGLLAPALLALRLRDPRGASPAPSAGAPRGSPAGTAPDGADRPLSRRFWGYVALATIFALGNSSDAFLLVKAREVGFSPATLPLLWFLHHVVKTLVGLPGGALSDRLPRGAVVAAGWGAYALAYAGFAAARAPWQVAALFVAYAAYHGLAEGAERALVADLVERGSRGRAFGWYHAADGVAALPASLLTGYLWTAFGSAVALGACAGFAAVAALGMGAAPSLRRRPERAP
jgi:MFS family permease